MMGGLFLDSYELLDAESIVPVQVYSTYEVSGAD
jgi:hypothetical protein